MLFHFRTRIGSTAGNNPFYFILNPIRNQRPKLSQTLTLEMVTQASSKRPMCPSCSKPARICLCTRLKTPSLENSVAVTILQHSLEKKHPLNSTRIATLGFNNLNVVSVSDVNFEARFVIRLLEPDFEMGSVGLEVKSTSFCEIQNYMNFDHIDGSNSQCGSVVNSEPGQFSEYPKEKKTSSINTSEECSLRSNFGRARICQNREDDTDFDCNSELLMNNILTLEAEHELALKESIGVKGMCAFEATQKYFVRQSDLEMVSGCLTLDEATLANKTADAHQDKLLQPCLDPIGVVPRGIDEPAITFTIAKYGVISSLTHHWIQLTQLEKLNFDHLLASQVALDALARGFVVKKLNNKQLNGSVACEEYEEFEITVPPGSVLLFPSEKSVGVEAIDFEVKNLIVLDGTWAKAKRMYNENPWLKLLPHLKLDLDKMSLYSEVRHQPRAGCLSTIESIVYALKAVGDNPEGLDSLLDVFESMVGDQRRCKDERLSSLSLV